MRFKRQFRKWRYPHGEDDLKLIKPYNNLITEIHRLDIEADKLLKEIEFNRPSKESIRTFLENM